MKSDFIQLLQERGYLHQATDLERLDHLAATSRLIGYIGFDPTADSLHAGSLVQIMLLRRLQQTGHKPIVLMGGGTAKVGDPSGRDEGRQLMDDARIAANMAGIKGIFKNYLQFGEGATDALMVNNADWLDKLGYINFLREVGTHFTINRMLTFDSVKARLEREQPLTFLEFNYMIMQAYDFVELRRHHGCVLQMGGSDQWGNIVNGVELGRRLHNQELFGVTSPLLTTASGAKMGKTANGAVWLNADKLPAYDFWQYWRNTEDADVGRFLRLFTDLPLVEIAKLEKLGGAEINEAKIILANAVTSMAHGAEAASTAAATAAATFGAGGTGAALPVLEVSLSPSPTIAEIIVQLGFAGSKGEAKRLIEQGGVKLNDQLVADSNSGLTATMLPAGGEVRLSVGKKRHAILRQRS